MMPDRHRKSRLIAIRPPEMSRVQKPDGRQLRPLTVRETLPVPNSKPRSNVPVNHVDDDDDDDDDSDVDIINSVPSKTLRAPKGVANNSLPYIISSSSEKSSDDDEKTGKPNSKRFQGHVGVGQTRGDVSPSEAAKEKLDRSLQILTDFKKSREEDSIRPINTKSPSPIKVVPKKRGRPPKAKEERDPDQRRAYPNISDAAATELLEREKTVQRLFTETEEELEQTICHAERLEGELVFLKDEVERIRGMASGGTHVPKYTTRNSYSTPGINLSSEPLAVCTPTKIGDIQDSAASPVVKNISAKELDSILVRPRKGENTSSLNPERRPHNTEADPPKRILVPRKVSGRQNFTTETSKTAPRPQNTKAKSKAPIQISDSEEEVGRLEVSDGNDKIMGDDYGFNLENSVDMGNEPVIDLSKGSVNNRSNPKPIAGAAPSAMAKAKDTAPTTIIKQPIKPKSKTLNNQAPVGKGPIQKPPHLTTNAQATSKPLKSQKGPAKTLSGATKRAVETKKVSVSSPDSLLSAVKPLPKPSKRKAVFMAKNRKYDEEKLKEMSDTIDDLQKYFGVTD